MSSGSHSYSCVEDIASVDGNEYYLRLAKNFFLSFEMVMEAKTVFEHYLHVEVEANSSRHPASGNEYFSPHIFNESNISLLSGLPTTAGASTGNGVNDSFASPSAISTEGPSETAPPVSSITKAANELGVAGLQAFFLDLGVPKSALEVADVIQQVRSYPAELALLKRKEAAERKLAQQRRQEQLEAELEASSGRGAKGKKAKKAKPSAHSSVTSLDYELKEEEHTVETTIDPSAEAAMGITFPLFLLLLQKRLSDDENSPDHKDAEVLQVFHSLDADHDGVLSEEDVQRALVYLLQEEEILSDDRDLVALGSMHPVELRSALLECDMNADGLVTTDDLLAVLRV